MSLPPAALKVVKQNAAVESSCCRQRWRIKSQVLVIFFLRCSEDTEAVSALRLLYRSHLRETAAQRPGAYGD